MKEIKMQRGGKREGAGRKPGSINRATAIKRAARELGDIKGTRAQQAVSAAVVLGLVDESAKWLDLLNQKDPWLRFRVMVYLTDRRDGKPKQAVELDADIKTTLANMTTEQLQQHVEELAGRLGFVKGQ